MGQAFGKSFPQDAVKSFSNLPTEALESLWVSYHADGDNWGLDIDTAQVVFDGAKYLKENIGFTEEELSKTFQAFDTDNNKLVDALELLIAIALMSGMDTVDKLNFTFSSYDFNDAGKLSYDEVSLLFRTCIKALSKAFPTKSVFTKATYADVEVYATNLFKSCGKEIEGQSITLKEFQYFCSTHPVIVSWLNTLATISPYGEAAVEVTSAPPAPMVPKTPDNFSVYPTKFRRASRMAEEATAAALVDKKPVLSKADLARRESQMEELKALDSPRRRQRAEEITAEEAIRRDFAKAAAYAASHPTADSKPYPLPWFSVTDKMEPEELPPKRKDPPQDVVTPLWVHGFGSATAPRMRKTAFYGSSGAILYPAANMLVGLSKDAELGWSQNMMCEHLNPISCMDVDSSGKLAVTGDSVLDYLPQPPRLPMVKEVVFESEHPTTNVAGEYVTGIHIPGAEKMMIFFDPQTVTENGYDSISFYKDETKADFWGQAQYSGDQMWPGAKGNPPLEIAADNCTMVFRTDGSVAKWGYKFTVRAVVNPPLNNAIAVRPKAPKADSEARICLWDVMNGRVTQCLRVPYGATGVRCLDFSSDSKYVLALLEDERSTVSIYSCETGALVFTKPMITPAWGSVMEEKILDVKFSGCPSIFTTAGTRGVVFHIEEGGSAKGANGLRIYEEREGLYHTAGASVEKALATTLCRFDREDETISGHAGGEICFWRGRNCLQLLKTHTYSITALHYSTTSKTLISGCRHGVINLYKVTDAGNVAPEMRFLPLKTPPKIVSSRQLEVISSFDILGQNDLQSFEIRSLCLSADATKALLSTFTGELKELSCIAGAPPGSEEGDEAPPAEEEGEEGGAAGGAPSNLGKDVNGGALVRTHFPWALEKGSKGPQIAAMCKSPAAPGQFLTCGADSTLRVWSAGEGEPHKCMQVVDLACGASKIVCSSTMVVVAFDGIKYLDKKGYVQLLSFPDLKMLTALQICSGEVMDMKFTPEGNMLAIACEDNCIRCYSVSPDGSAITERGVLKTENTPHYIDFSTDGMYLRSADMKMGDETSCMKLSLFDVSANFGEPVTSDETLKAVTWQTNSVPLNWDIKGIWSTLVDVDFSAAQAALLKEATEKLGVALPEAEGVPADGDEGAAEPEPEPEAEAEAEEEEEEGGEEDAEAGEGDEGEEGEEGEEVKPKKKKKKPYVPKPEEAPKAPELGPELQAELANRPIFKRFEAITCVERSQTLLVMGMPDGTLMLHRVPNTTYDPSGVGTSSPIILPIHAGSISSVVFLDEGARLVTAGAEDGLIQIWKINYDAEEVELDPEDLEKEKTDEDEEPPAEEEEEEEAEETEAPLYDSCDDEDLVDGEQMKAHVTVYEKTKDELSALRSWTGSVGVDLDASVKSKTFADLPKEELELDWVHGFSARTTRAAVRYNHEGHIVYPAATMGVVYNKTTGKQNHCAVHHDEITCLDVHMDGLTATAHKGPGSIYVSVWDSISGKVLRRLSCGLVNSASAICFDPKDSAVIAVACQDEKHTVMIFNWKMNSMIGKVYGGARKVLSMVFSLGMSVFAPPVEEGEEGEEPPPEKMQSTVFPRLVCGGVNSFSIVDRVEGGAFQSRTGLFGPDTKKCNVNCVVAVPLCANPEGAETEFLLGMADGTIGALPRGPGRLAAFTPILVNDEGAPSGAVTSLWVVKTDTPLAEADEVPEYKVVVGATNGMIKVLDKELGPLNEYNLYGPKISYGLVPMGKLRGFKSICVDKSNRKILYSTAAAEIGELDLDSGKDINEGPIVTGHFREQLHGLATHPLRQEGLTSGDDKMLRGWDLETHKQLFAVVLPEVSRCATFNPNGTMIAAGLGGALPARMRNPEEPRENNGKVVIMSYLQGVVSIVHQTSDATDVITSVVFSPDESKLYVSSLDKKIYVYDAFNNFVLLADYSLHEEGVRSLDITSDGKYIASVGVGSEVKVWDAGTGVVVKDDVRNGLLSSSKWFVRQNVYGSDCVGAFPSYAASSDIVTLTQSKSSSLLVTANVNGCMSLLKCPSIKPFAPSKSYSGHTPGGVSKVAFSVDDKYLLSVGKDDKTVLQWKLVSPTEEKAIALAPLADVLDKLQPTKGSPLVASGYDVNAVKDKTDSVIPAALKFRGKGDVTTELAEGEGDVDGGNEKITEDLLVPPSMKLKGVVGIGNNAVAGSSMLFPQASYSGSGDIFMCFGKSCVSLARNTLKQKPWLPVPTCAGAAIQQVSAYAVSNDGRYILIGSKAVTGGKTVMPGILAICSATSGTVLSLLADDIEGGVSACAFSADGLRCACLTGDSTHSLQVYSTTDASLDWSDAVLLTKTQVSINVSISLSFLAPPAADAEAPFRGPYELVTAGQDGLKFWSLKGRNLMCFNGQITETAGTLAATTALVGLTDPQKTVSGDADGNIWIWNGADRGALLGKHDGPVTSLTAFKAEKEGVVGPSGVISGSKDSIKVWNLDEMSIIQEFSISSLIVQVGRSMFYKSGESIDMSVCGKNSPGYVTAISADATLQRLLITLSSSLVIEVATNSGAASIISEGCGSQITAMCPHTGEANTILTASADGMIRCWNVSDSGAKVPGVLGALPSVNTATALQFIKADCFAVGTTESADPKSPGVVMIVEISPTYEMTVVHQLSNVGKGKITFIKMSKVDAKGVIKCAVGSEDGSVYVYEMTAPTYNFLGSFAVDSSLSVPFGLDFSKAGRYMRVFYGPLKKAKYFIFQKEEEVAGGAAVAVEVAKPEWVVSNIVFASVSFPTAPEAKSVLQMSAGRAPVSMSTCPVTPSSDVSMMAVTYSDGHIGLVKGPYVAPNATMADGADLQTGPTFGVFAKQSVPESAVLCTYGGDDGSILIWDAVAP